MSYISNHSSGKMGFAIAAAAARRGAKTSRWYQVRLPLPAPPFSKRVDVMTALEMEAAVNASVQQRKYFYRLRRRRRLSRSYRGPRKNQKAGHAG
ncbi:phosphopantothenoylcysteine decarboxylase [Shigella flexneri]